MTATPDQINALFLGQAESYGYVHISADGGTQPYSFNLDDDKFATVDIIKTPTAHSVTIRRGGKLMGIEINNATYGVLTAARAAFEPLGFGTPAAWDTLMMWAVETLC